MPRARVLADLFFALILVGAIACRSKLAPTSSEFTNPPVMDLPVIALEKRILRVIDSAAGPLLEQARAQLDLVVRVRGINGPDHRAIIYVSIVDTNTDAAVTVLESDVQLLPLGDSSITASVVVDARALGLAPGDYVLQPVAAVGVGDAATGGMRSLLQTVTEGGYGSRVVFVGAPHKGIKIVDEGLADIAGYQAAIASGNPEIMYRGLSQSVQHHRTRGRYALAEKVVSDFNAATATDPTFDPLHRIFRFWNVDDRLRAGDTVGAINLLGQLIAAAPIDSGFLGESFVARALMKRARIHFSVGDFASAVSDYTQLFTTQTGAALPDLSSVGSAASGLMGRADALLELGNFTDAAADYTSITDRNNQCQTGAPPAAADPNFPCPSTSQADHAARQLRIIASDRSWYRDTPEQLIATFQDAINSRGHYRTGCHRQPRRSKN